MTKRLKVYSVRLRALRPWKTTSTQPRVIVAAKSQAEAVRLMNARGLSLSVHFLRGYGGETGNPVAVETATAEPGVVFYATTDRGRAGEWERA